MLYLASLVIILLILIALFYLRQRMHMKAEAKECAKEAKLFHEKLKQLSNPERFFTDEEVRKLKNEFAPLLKRVNKLYGTIFISNEYLDEAGLKDFLDERRLVNHKQFENNKEYNKRYYRK